MSPTNFVMLVMYDVPTCSPTEKKAYRLLATYLKRTGFYYLQGSIYAKPLSEKYKSLVIIENIKKIVVAESNIRSVILTHHAFLSMQVICGKESFGENLIKKKNSVIVV